MAWNQRIFGKDSDAFRSCLPDTMVWVKKDGCLLHLSAHYLRDPAFDDYPVVGVTWDQAIAYSNWRSDRVFEKILIDFKFIQWDPEQDEESFFTVEKYYSGQIPTLRQEISIYYPDFRLPSLTERELLIQFSDSLEHRFLETLLSKHASANAIGPRLIFSDQPVCLTSTGDYVPINPVSFRVGKENFEMAELLFHLRGNALEWSSTPGIATGGSAVDTYDRIMASDTFQVKESTAWTGFRNVFEWKKWADLE